MRKPNYRFERVERERLQAERQARRDQRKARNQGDAAGDVHKTTDDDLPARPNE